MKHAYSKWATWPGRLLLLFGLLTLGLAPAAAQAPNWQSLEQINTISGTGSQVQASIKDAAGNLLLVGTFYGTIRLGSITLTGGDNRSNAFVAKWSPATNRFIWAYEVGATGYTSASAVAVSGSNIYVAGTFRATTATFGATTLTNSSSIYGTSSYADVFVAKLVDAGPSAELVWAQRPTGTIEEEITALAVQGNQVYVAGYMTGTPPGPPNICRGCANTMTFGATSMTTRYWDADGFVAKLLDNGASASFAWALQIGGEARDKVNDLVVSNNELYLVGAVSSQPAYFGSVAPATVALSVGTEYRNNGFVAKVVDAGTTATTTEAQLLSTPAGSSVADMAVSGPDVYIAGYFVDAASFGTATLTAAGSADAFVAKLTPSSGGLRVAWAHRAGGTGYDYARKLVVQGPDVYVVGALASPSADFGATTLTQTTANPMFLTKLLDGNTAGSFSWAQTTGTQGAYQMTVMAYTVDIVGNRVYTAGYATPATTFGTLSFASQVGSSIGFLASVADLALPVTSRASVQPLACYPNPAHTQVQVPGASAATLLTLTDALGRTVRTGTGSVLSVQAVTPGLYLLQAATPGQPVRTARLVVE